MMRWLRLFRSGSLAGAAIALGACGDDSGTHGVVSDAGVRGSAGAAGVGGAAGSGDAGSCAEVTPESVGCAARYDDQSKESALAYGACDAYLAWLASGPPHVVCIYDMDGGLVYWRSCEDAPVTCGTGPGNACHANGLQAPSGPACFLPAPMRPATPGTGGGVNSDVGVHDAGSDDAGKTDAGSASVVDAGPADAG
jgi:hypothetical protein